MLGVEPAVEIRPTGARVDREGKAFRLVLTCRVAWSSTEHDPEALVAEGEHLVEYLRIIFFGEVAAKEPDCGVAEVSGEVVGGDFRPIMEVTGLELIRPGQ